MDAGPLQWLQLALALLVAFSIPIILIADVIFIIIVVFFERKNPSATLAWVMALFFIPVVGFVLYLFLGQTYTRDRMFRVKREADERVQALVRSQERELEQKEVLFPGGGCGAESLRHTILLLLYNNRAVLSANNDVQVFVDGKEKFEALLANIRSAADFIHLEY